MPKKFLYENIPTTEDYIHVMQVAGICTHKKNHAQKSNGIACILFLPEYCQLKNPREVAAPSPPPSLPPPPPPSYTYTLFSNSLVLSRKILSSWMAQAKIARAWPGAILVHAFISTRAAPGPHQARTKGFLNEAAPNSGLNSACTVKCHTIPGPRRAVEAFFLSWNCSVIF